MLSEGFYDVPKGHLATVVTHLEMTAPRYTAPAAWPAGVTITRETPDTVGYRALFRAIGAPWLWTSRLRLGEDTLAAILTHPDVAVWIVRRDDAAIGLVELDFRETAACELAFFGLVPEATGGGLGVAMMAHAQTHAFTADIARFHVHTCTLDAPHALAFYQKHGFRAIRSEVEIMPDPRATGLLPTDTAPNIPLFL